MRGTIQNQVDRETRFTNEFDQFVHDPMALDDEYEQSDFLCADTSRMEEIKELSENICLMVRIQPADNTSDAGPSYDFAFIIE
ncbi:hypothetical protein Tco_0741011, partial [Tanacetum coccineum]